jgi:hypothetical protein
MINLLSWLMHQVETLESFKQSPLYTLAAFQVRKHFLAFFVSDENTFAAFVRQSMFVQLDTFRQVT